MGTKPATVQVHTFTVKPGETIDWHYHRALAYVVIEHGTLSEQHLNGNGTCSAWVAFGAGSAFVGPGEVHKVTNTGKGEAVITWATAFPTEDGVFKFSLSSQSAASILPRTRRGATESLDQLKPCSGIRAACRTKRLAVSFWKTAVLANENSFLLECHSL